MARSLTRSHARKAADDRRARNIGFAICGGFGTVIAIALIGAALEGEDRPGDPSVYDRIEVEQSCQKLFKGIDRTVADSARRDSDDPLQKVASSYATAYAERLAEMQCPRRSS
jgi:hypothetical protein